MAEIGELELDVMVKRMSLLVRAGRMPRNISEVEGESVTRQMIQQMAEVVEKHDLPAAVVEDMLAIVGQERPKAA